MKTTLTTYLRRATRPTIQGRRDARPLRLAGRVAVEHDVPFQRSLRLIGNDMKVMDYKDTGYLNYQVPPAWWAH